MDFDLIKEILRALEREGVAYVIVGSIAMAAHGLVRATRDMDFFVDPAEENVQRLRRALHVVFNDPNIQDILGEDLRGDYPAICYTPPQHDFSIDILARLGDMYAFADIESEEVDFDGVKARVATPAMVYRMKRDTVRPQDRADAQALKIHFDLDEG